ncbi:hypothetical protein FB446DRAFT_731834 [Lentinula raphanica]|nr:hypothetical protein FB446DRAFT_731834 [Lentinula raphanica]
MSSRKRKHNRERFSNHLSEAEDTPSTSSASSALYIQAYEADITRGPRAHVAALSLEVRTVEGELDVGSGLMRLGGEDMPSRSLDDEWDNHTNEEPMHPDPDAVWVDRYDARLLLDPQTLLNSLANEEQDIVAPAPSSPSGWSDLSSDAEDTYFLTADETEDFRREKRRRLMEQAREDRLKARMEEDGEEIWGGSDEEPEESQREIMRRTAKSILTSPNPAQLELRILANHGADPRFAFLRGRWSRAWKTVKARVRADEAEQKQKAALNSVRTGLVEDYADSDESGEDDGAQAEVKEERPSEAVASGSSTSASAGPSEKFNVEEAQALRRARAKEWMANRKAAA